MVASPYQTEQRQSPLGTFHVDHPFRRLATHRRGPSRDLEHRQHRFPSRYGGIFHDTQPD